MSMPASAGTNEGMEKLSGVSYQTTEQHNDISAARQTRDVNDTLQKIDYLSEWNPFSENETLFIT